MSRLYQQVSVEVQTAIQDVARRRGITDKEFLAEMIDDVDYPEIASRIVEKVTQTYWSAALEAAKHGAPVLLVTQLSNGSYHVTWGLDSRHAPAGGPTASEIESLLNVVGAR